MNYADKLKKLKKFLDLFYDRDKEIKLPNIIFRSVVSYTTRPMRDYEVDGREHWFVDDDKVNSEMEAGNIVAYTEIGPYKYYVDKQTIDDTLNNLYIIDPKGIYYLMDHYNGERKFAIIYVNTKKSIRDERAKHRPGYKEDIYKQRCSDENTQFYKFENCIDDYISNYNMKFYMISNNGNDINFTIESLERMIKDNYDDNLMYLVVGRTCSGKDTICNELIKRGINNGIQ